MYLDLIKIYRRDDQTVRPFIFWPVRYCGGKKFVKRFGYKLEFLVTTNIDLKYPQIFTSDHQGSLDVPVAAIGYNITFITYIQFCQNRVGNIFYLVLHL